MCVRAVWMGHISVLAWPAQRPPAMAWRDWVARGPVLAAARAQQPPATVANCRPQASSPDEEALVEGAAFLGYKLVSRTTDQVRLARAA